MADRIPAEVFPPGEFVREELEVRGWTQLDLAEIIGCPPRLVNEVVAGKRSITPNTARRLGEAFGTGAQVWLNLESAYQLHRTGPADGAVAKRAKLFEKAPIREMTKRGWIEPAENPDVLKQRLLDHFEIESLDDEPEIWPHAARKSTSYLEVTPAQWAWLCRAKKLSRCIAAPEYRVQNLRMARSLLRHCLQSVEETRDVPRILTEAGIRLVVIEPLSGTKTDGACFWLDRKSPVVALSLRYDRVDYFWHTLMHELAHVENRDGLKGNVWALDVDLLGTGRSPDEVDTRPDAEKSADRTAVESLVDQSELEDFIARTRPLYSKAKIRNFARRLGVHPGIVVGQLQHRHEISWAHSRNMLEKVRQHITQSALTDGWGSMPPAEL